MNIFVIFSRHVDIVNKLSLVLIIEIELHLKDIKF